MKRFILPGIVLVLLTAGCTQAQVDRAAAISAQADVRLAQADRAIALAQQAVDQGKILADQLGDVRAQQIVAQAQAGLAAATAARDVAKGASDASHAALEAAKASQQAGGSSVDVLLAALTAFLPTAGVAVGAIRQAIKSAQAFRQTVAGIEDAKKLMTSDQIASLHGSLAEAQDDHVKATVSQIKATL